MSEPRTTPTKVRRVITGLDDQGRSTFIIDDHGGMVREMDTMVGVTLTDIWETTSSPANNSGTADAVTRPVRLEPIGGGSIFRTVEFPPDSAWRDKVDIEAAFASISADSVHDRSSDDPMRHTTNTIDYIVVLRGEIEAVLDTGSVLLKAGDTLVQRGTVHSWSVKSNDGCMIAAILIAANPVT